ncbi:MAG: archaeosortase/exosortase family protein [Deltaproteobacteria bacterium]|nr:archaeosortase/exosortase family protein [Deltaproteobacteria bacterium]
MNATTATAAKMPPPKDALARQFCDAKGPARRDRVLHASVLLQVAFFALWASQYHQALVWITTSWQDATYDSWGFLPLIFAAGLALRGLPTPRRYPRPRLLGVALTLNILDVTLAPLGINSLSALLALLAFFAIAATFWKIHRPATMIFLLLGALPLVFWADVLAGHRLQALATRAAGAALHVYGLDLRVEGTVLFWGHEGFAVDAACSGIHMLFAGLLLGALIQPLGRTRLVFWPILALALFVANVGRVTALTLHQIATHHAPSHAIHEAIGLVTFVLCVAPVFLWTLRRHRRRSGK